MKNPTLLQYFHWYYPDGGKLWSELAERADGLNDIGINMVWLPPACKGASGGYSVGYDTYDLFDLGEFDQKGTIATKYGDKRQLLTAIDALKKNNIAVLLDVVVNHKMGADEICVTTILSASTVARTKGRMAGAKEWTISFPAPESRRWRKYGYVRTVWRNKAVCRPATATAQNHSRRIPPRY